MLARCDRKTLKRNRRGSSPSGERRLQQNRVSSLAADYALARNEAPLHLPSVGMAPMPLSARQTRSPNPMQCLSVDRHSSKLLAQNATQVRPHVRHVSRRMSTSGRQDSQDGSAECSRMRRVPKRDMMATIAITALPGSGTAVLYHASANCSGPPKTVAPKTRNVY